MYRTVLAALLLLPVVLASVHAQRQVTPPPGLEAPPPPPGGVAVSPQGRIVISPELCARLARSEAAVPSAEYRPGVDVDGKPVAPADLPAPPAMPIEIGVDLQKQHGVGAGSTLLRGKSIVGVVTVQDGRAWLGGVPLADNEYEMMLAACREAKPKR